MSYLEEFESYLASSAPTLGGYHPHLEKAFWEMVLASGKRFRPKLIFGVVNAYKSLLLKNSFPVALALECMHTYSLIHDDLPSMDNAALRRNHPTLHVTYDEVTALLVGDALNTYAFELIAKAPLDDSIKIEIIKELSSAAGIDGMVLGQALDCHFEKKPLSLEQLSFLHLHKTGKLISASLKIGALICNLDKRVVAELGDIGLDIGLLFQINDDIIDETCTAEQAGKTTKNDGNKNSYVNLLGLIGAKNAKDELISKIENRIQELPKLLNRELISLVHSLK